MKKVDKSETTTLKQMADELIIANKKIAFQNEEKAKRASELFIAKADKAKRAAELVIANAEQAKLAVELVIANAENEKFADELIIANKELVYQNEEKAKRAAELVIADVNRTKLEAESVIAKIEKAKWIAKSIIADKELSYQNEEKAKRAAELVIGDAEKAKRSAELVIANIKKAKRSAELVIANIEKAKRSAELVIAHKELAYQRSEKSKLEAELIIANVEKAKRAAELVFANIDKSKRAAEIIFMNKELVLAKEKEKLVGELTLVNKELTIKITERKRYEKALFESEERFRLLFNQAPLGYQSLDIDGNFIDVNQQWLDTLGYYREEVIGKWFGDFLSPVYQEGFRKRFPIFKAQGYIHSEFEMLHKNGNILFIAFEGKIGYDSNGEFKQTHCILQDITEIKNAQEETNRQKGLFQSVIDNLPIMITYFDKNGKILLTNNELVKVLGWTHIEWETENIFAKCYPDPTYMKEILDFMNSGEGGWKDSRTNTKYGTVIETAWTNIKLSDGVSMGIGQDITERKMTDRKLRESELKYRSLIESSSDAIFCVDEKGQYQFTNHLFASTFGKTPDYFVGKTFWDVYDKEHADMRFEASKRLFQNGKSESLEVEVPLPDKTLYFWATTNPIKDETGKVVLNLTHAVDISERKHSELALRESEERYRSLHENAGLGIAYYKQDGTVISYNRIAAGNMNGVPEDFNGKSIYDLFPKKDAELYHARIKKSAISDKPIVYEDMVSLPIGNIHFMSTFSKICDLNNNIIGIQIISQNITKLKQAEESLKLSQAKYQAIFESTGTATLIVEADHTIFLANHECVSLTGYSQEELIGQKWTQYVDAESLKEMVKNHNLRRENPSLAPKKYEVKLVNKKGETRFVMLDIGMVPGTGQSIVSIIDITDRLLAERAIKSKVEELERFNKLMLNREMKMIELKNEVNELLTMKGVKEKYRITE